MLLKKTTSERAEFHADWPYLSLSDHSRERRRSKKPVYVELILSSKSKNPNINQPIISYYEVFFFLSYLRGG